MILKYLVLLGLLAFAQKASADHVLTTGVINEYADRMLELVRPAMVRNGFDPFKVDNISHDFWFKPLFINYTGHIDLRDGWLMGLSTIRRAGDVKMKYEKKMVTLTADLMVDFLMGEFEHTLKIFDIGPSGHLTAIIKKQTIEFSILVDFDRLTFHLQQFALTNNEDLDIKMTGLGLADIVVNAIVRGITAIFKNSISNAIGNQIKNSIELLIEKLPPLLPPASEKLSPEEIIVVMETLLAHIILDPEIRDQYSQIQFK